MMALPGWVAGLRASAWIDLPLRVARAWSDDHIARRSAALSYYTVFSLAPLLVLVLGVLGLVVDRGRLHEQLVAQFSALAGSQAGTMVGEVLARADKPAEGLASAGLGVVALLFGATGVFVELKNSLDGIWHVRMRAGGLLGLVRGYFAPLSMILGFGFLLLVSLLLSAFVAAIGKHLAGVLPGLAVALHVADTATSCVLVALLFTMIYRVLPAVRMSWRDAAMGAGVAAVLFAVGRVLIGMYLGRTSTGSAYGAAGSLVVILAWVFYSSQILFLGAVFTRAVIERRGVTLAPTAGAEAIPGCRTPDSAPPALALAR